ncbi:hypothetical protein DRP05_06200 [Archaeoglobales archaeon]|nr:MAG: hypothetical protein DRP05_06200 [Archaeoglobales archaeon]
MLKLVKDIDIKEVIFDKHSEFNIKRFKLGNVKIDRPTKVIDAKNISKALFENFKKKIEKPIFETSKIVRSRSIEKVLDETDDENFKKKVWILRMGF